MIPLHRYEIVEKTSQQVGYMPTCYFLHLEFCGGRDHSYGNGYASKIQVSEDMFNSVKPGDKIDLRYEVTT